MAGIEVNVSPPRLQPQPRHSRHSLRQEQVRSVCHSPPILNRSSVLCWLNGAAFKPTSAAARIVHNCA
jgi:hypothetical protein